jgi:trimeric autotransporter adhesin
MKRTIKIETASFLTRLHRYPSEAFASLQTGARHCRQVLFALGLLALCQMGHAVTPAPDGGYAGGNTAEGQNALLSLTTGTYNTAIGLFSLRSNTESGFNTAIGAGTLFANTADENTAAGAGALLSNITGRQNTANGAFTLFSNTTGNFNTATGVKALFINTDGDNDTAIGYFALYSNTTGNYNTGIGDYALGNNSTGDENTAIGVEALQGNTSGVSNTGVGFAALVNNSADNNTAAGTVALQSNTTGTQNTAAGVAALYNNTEGSYNTASGLGVLHENTIGNSNTAGGINALYNNTTGGLNVALGDRAGFNLTTGSNNIIIGGGVLGVAGDENTIRIGDPAVQTATYIAGIVGATVPSGAPVVVANDGHLGTTTSSKRFKEDIKPTDKASETLLALKPVTFRYKKEIDPTGMSQFGLVAEEVEKVNPDLVVHDKEGKPYTVRYDQVNAMLLNEFLKEHRKVQQLEDAVAQQHNDFETRIAGLQKEMEKVVAHSEGQGKKIQKVSARVELIRAAPRTVANN